MSNAWVRRRPLLFVAVLLPCVVAAGNTPQPTSASHRDNPADVKAVLATVNKVFAAFETGDAAAMLRQVYPDGRVTASGLRGDGASNLRQQTWTVFARRIKPDAAFQERISDPQIHIDGDIAMVWAPFVVRVGGKVSNCGFDHFDLVRENSVWKVMNLTFSSRVTDCVPT
jgi:ketosteroid isomerase-like protein